MLICMVIHWVPIEDWPGCRETHVDLHGYPLSSHWRLTRLQRDTDWSAWLSTEFPLKTDQAAERHRLICMVIHWVPIEDWPGCRETQIDLHGYPLSSHWRLTRLQKAHVDLHGCPLSSHWGLTRRQRDTDWSAWLSTEFPLKTYQAAERHRLICMVIHWVPIEDLPGCRETDWSAWLSTEFPLRTDQAAERHRLICMVIHCVLIEDWSGCRETQIDLHIYQLSSHWRLIRLQRNTDWSAWLSTEFPLKTDQAAERHRLICMAIHWVPIEDCRETHVDLHGYPLSSHWRLIRLQRNTDWSAWLSTEFPLKTDQAAERHRLICMAIHWVPIEDWSGSRETQIDLHGYPLSSHWRLTRLQKAHVDLHGYPLSSHWNCRETHVDLHGNPLSSHWRLTRLQKAYVYLHGCLLSSHWRLIRLQRDTDWSAWLSTEFPLETYQAAEGTCWLHGCPLSSHWRLTRLQKAHVDCMAIHWVPIGDLPGCRRHMLICMAIHWVPIGDLPGCRRHMLICMAVHWVPIGDLPGCRRHMLIAWLSTEFPLETYQAAEGTCWSAWLSTEFPLKTDQAAERHRLISMAVHRVPIEDWSGCWEAHVDLSLVHLYEVHFLILYFIFTMT